MEIDRERARHALQQITEIENRELDNYVNYVKGLPAVILQNGLGQALATLLAASKGERDDHRLLYDQLNEWLCGENGNRYSPYRRCRGSDLMRAITSGSEEEYVVAQGEALAYLQWLKKFAVAYLSEERKKEKNA